MKSVFVSITLIFALYIIINKGDKRAIAFLLSSFFLPGYFNTAHIIIPISFVLSLCVHGEIVKKIENYPLRYVSVIIFFIYFIVSLFDDITTGVHIVTKPILYFSETYLFLFIGFSLVNYLESWKKVSSTIMIVFLVFSCYGFYTWIIQNNPWYDFCADLYETEGIWSNIQDRGYRVNSFLENPIVYGMVMALGSGTIILYLKNSKSPLVIMTFVLTVLNVFLSNSRTSILAFVIMILIFQWCYRGISKKIFLSALCVIMILIILYGNLTSFRLIVDSTSDVLSTGGEEIQGSTMSLKADQWIGSLYYFYQSPFWGHGIDYYSEVIFKVYKKTKLAGLEGYVFRILIELGVFMLIAFFYFIYDYLKSLYNVKNGQPLFFSVCVAQFVAFMFFLIATGDKSHAFEYCFIIIGLNYKMCFEKRNKYQFNPQYALRELKNTRKDVCLRNQ